MSSAELTFYHLIPKHSSGTGQRRLYGGYAGLEFVLYLPFDSLHDAVSQQRCPFSMIKGMDVGVFLAEVKPRFIYLGNWLSYPAGAVCEFSNCMLCCRDSSCYPLSNYSPRRSASIILICINCGGNDDN